MEIQTKIISKEIIKPSSPTPKSLQKHHLSFLDQLMPPLFISFVYFYESKPQKSDHLKKSLSETLSRFYPLAGRLVGNLYVDCNDGGVPFSEAEADCNLSKVIYNPNPKDMNKFLPNYKNHEPQDFIMAVQTTYFRGGGLAVGILISHKIADASSIVMFANTWSAIARNGDGGGVPLPKFDAAAYFLPADMSGFNSAAGMMKDELATRIFTFSADTISLLRERYSGGGGGGGRPSREEALAAFIWIRFISATGVRSDPKKACTVIYPLNMPGRVDPLSAYHFGNLFLLPTIVKPAIGDDGIGLLRKVDEAVKAADSEKHLHLMKEMLAQAENGGEPVSFGFSSRCGLPSYEADFGSGRPVWIGVGGLPYKNLAIFTDTKNGGGIEALIHLTKQDMKKFEGDLEVQIFIENNFGAELKLPSVKGKM